MDIAATALLTYEIVIRDHLHLAVSSLFYNPHRILKWILSSRWSMVKILYILARYPPLIYLHMSFFSRLPPDSQSLSGPDTIQSNTVIISAHLPFTVRRLLFHPGVWLLTTTFFSCTILHCRAQYIQLTASQFEPPEQISRGPLTTNLHSSM